jgi:hypothetical protein
MEKRSVNLCAHYLLPLISLNKLMFGKPDNFINCYLSEEGKHLVVEVKEFPVQLEQHTCYKFDLVNEFGTMIVFEIPSDYNTTVKQFIDGKFSHFSPEVKDIIRKKSGLRWRIPIAGGGVISAKELLALDRDDALRRSMEEQLAVKLSPEAELMSIPDETNYYNLGLRQVQQSH